MSAGDIFVFYYSGHGGQQPDLNGDEQDNKDETLVAYDREVIDDKIHEALAKFPAGARLVKISDSCNSGSNYRGRVEVKENDASIFRPIAKKSNKEVGIKAELIHLGGCRDGYSSSGYYSGGAFTMALCEAWDNGKFTGTFSELHSKLSENISSSQQPQYNEYGPVSDDFRKQRAFTVQIASQAEGTIELPVVNLSPIKAELQIAGEKQDYKFRAVDVGKYMIETEGQTDVVMSLYGPDDQTKLIKKDDDSGPGTNSRISTDLSPGTYFVRVQHYDKNKGTGPYSIRVSR